MSGTIPERDRRSMKRGLYALGFIIVFGSIGGVLSKYWDTLPAPPRSHKILLDGTKSNDADHILAVLMRVEFNAVKSKGNLSSSNETFYSSDADPNEVAAFYRKALDVPWSVGGDSESKGRRLIVYRKLMSGEMKMIVIEKRLRRDAKNQVTPDGGSIIGTADLK